MDIDKLIELFETYPSNYFDFFISIVRRPYILVLPPIEVITEKEPELFIPNKQAKRTQLNPKLFLYVLFSFAIGIVIQGAFPGAARDVDYFRAVIVGLVVWTGLAIAIFGFLSKVLEVQIGGISVITLILQILSVQYIVSSFVALVLGTLIYQNENIVAVLQAIHPYLAVLSLNPIYIYFVAQFLFLGIYLPYAFIKSGWIKNPYLNHLTTWHRRRILHNARNMALVLILGTVVLGWVTFSVVFSDYTSIVVQPVTPTPSATNTPTATFTPTPSNTPTNTGTNTATITPTETPTVTDIPPNPPTLTNTPAAKKTREINLPT